MSLFGLDEATKVFLYAQPTDMRKGFDGLYGLVVERLELDPRLEVFGTLNQYQIL